MFQTFEVSTSPEQGPPRLEALRGEMQAEGLDGFLVPRADVHQGEYVAPHDARLAWLTGFTGSAGFCAALADVAGVFIDGRYRLQVRDQVADVFTPVHWPETSLADWMKEHLPKGGTVGFDAWLHTVDEIEALEKALDGSGVTLRPSANLVDRIWGDQPAPPMGPFTAYPTEMAGKSHDAKRQELSAALKGKAAIITLPDSVAWLLNIRGSDTERNPVPQAFAVLHGDARVDLFARAGKADGIAAHLGPDVRLRDQADFASFIKGLQGPVQIDPKSAPREVLGILDEAGVAVIRQQDPCILPKARKTEAEIAGSREAHLRDGAAMVNFLCWLDREAPKGGLTEIDVVRSLEGFRRDTNALRDVSFETICGAGAHGAIVHYRVTEATNREVRAGELLLVDSGGQYLDGTTDITRTVAVGEVGETEKHCFTRVLQGMIAVSRARFPKGVGGNHLDALARYPLWLDGMDYDHGTGHGVGAYLSVHEGPQGLSRRAETVLEEGMILSNEPGYYREGAFGIRIENLIVVRAAPALPRGDAREMLDFETLTYVPIDRRLILNNLLSREERDWIDSYHADTLRLIGPRLDGAALKWLTQACAPLT